MNPIEAAQIVALRPVLESLVIRASKQPEQVIQMSDLDIQVIVNFTSLLFQWQLHG